jgi:hypothetical protein
MRQCESQRSCAIKQGTTVTKASALVDVYVQNVVVLEIFYKQFHQKFVTISNIGSRIEYRRQEAGIPGLSPLK